MNRCVIYALLNHMTVFSSINSTSLVFIAVSLSSQGHSDSGMSLSSDNMKSQMHLESLSGRPLSIMALAYVPCAKKHPLISDERRQTH